MTQTVPSQAMAGPSTKLIKQIEQLTKGLNHFHLCLRLLNVGPMEPFGFFIEAVDSSGAANIRIMGDGAKILQATMAVNDCYALRGSAYIHIDQSNGRKFAGTTKSITFEKFFD